VQSTDRVLIGATGTYEARCRHCFDPTLSGTPAGDLSAAAANADPEATESPAEAAAAETPVRAPARAHATRAKRS
jgi:hypothetical protein